MILGGTATAIAGVSAYAWYESLRPRIFELYVFDTPGAPAVFVRTENDKRILINGGANSDIIRHLTDILPFYSRRIDQVIAMDDDPKNVTGLIDVINRYEVGAVAVNNSTSTDATYKVFLSTMAEKSLEPRVLSKGDTLDLDTFHAKVLNAGPESFLTINDIFWLPGKSRVSVQKQMKGSASVLIVPYNPIPANLSKAFLAEVKPDYLIYSAAPAPKKKSAQKEKPDILAGILMDHRFNIRETGGVKVTYEGKSVLVRPI